MKFKLTKKQFNFLNALNGVSNFILNKTVDDNSISFEVSDVSGFQDEIYFNVVENGMNSEGDVNKFGKEVYLIYDTLLAQI